MEGRRRKKIEEEEEEDEEEEEKKELPAGEFKKYNFNEYGLQFLLYIERK